MEPSLKLNAIVIGATGAVGRELVDYLISNINYNKISIFVRRIIDRWVDLPEGKKEKLNIIEVENLDCLSNENEIKSLLNDNLQYHVLFNTLGSRVGRGNEEFRKVDFTYVVNSCILCEKLNINHFSNCSAGNADRNSCFLYSRVKGEAEDECLSKNVNYISILRPGIIADRDNDSRCMEKIAACLCCCWRITSKEIALGMMVDDLDYQIGAKEQKGVRISNSEIKALAQKGNIS
jgi:hypothetical protein